MRKCYTYQTILTTHGASMFTTDTGAKRGNVACPSALEGQLLPMCRMYMPPMCALGRRWSIADQWWKVT